MSSYHQSPQDEGYSEDPLSGSTVSIACPPWFANMSIRERSEFVMGLMAQLPTSEVADIVRNLRPRLYINFFNHLPAEVCLKILGYLDPDSLMRTAQASKEWMGLAFDRRLWEQLYIRDGFRLLDAEVERYERVLNMDEESQSSGQGEAHASKRRATPSRKLVSGLSDLDMMEIDTPLHKQPSIFGPVTGMRLTKEPMQDEDTAMTSPRSPSAQASHSFYHHKSQRRGRGLSNQSTRSGRSFTQELSSLVVLDRSTNKKRLNWQYLYSQRRKLESNWETEKFINFQLPHPDYPEEAHEECIYTLQYSGRYLVSGSRDRTLRIWNIDTQRLVRPPLRAHSGSVLCLQFDADPDEDLIVSGSSDATIVLWKFSTGQIIQRFRKAHRESVLNVRFDKRVLVTCSKDKLIKIFNRRPLNPGDVGYPGLPGGVHPVPTTLENYGFNPTPNAGLPVIPAYTLIGTLVGHSAAVNAVQIHGNEIVSASGDRHIKVWNWVDNICTRTLSGHKKGIACVQYDGRRIVSGSSDNEVRIYDKESGVVVATLRAHSNLVRTVQAGFADLPNGAEEDAELARLTDLRYFDAVDSGAVSQDISLRGRLPNAGSSRPEDITAYGAKIPPGGGGGRFGRIVSGSYDETVIIWRKDREGVWKAQHTLRQEDAAQSALRHVKKSSATQDTPQSGAPSPTAQSSQGNGSSSNVPNSDAWIRPLIDQLVAEGVNSFRHGLRRHPQLLQRVELSEKLATLPTADRPSFQAAIVHALQEQQHSSAAANATTSQQTPPQQNHIASTIVTHSTTNSSSAAAGPSQPTTDRVNNPPVVNTHPMLGQQTTTTTATPAAAPALPPAPGATPPGGGNMARVFKLQFDARRIICCSQTTTIVGWDFANGDEKLIEASRFFAPIE